MRDPIPQTSTILYRPEMLWCWDEDQWGGVSIAALHSAIPIRDGDDILLPAGSGYTLHVRGQQVYLSGAAAHTKRSVVDLVCRTVRRLYSGACCPDVYPPYLALIRVEGTQITIELSNSSATEGDDHAASRSDA